MNLKPQPKARQRALLAEWGIDVSRIPEDGGIDNHGIWFVGEHVPPESMDVVAVNAGSGELLRTQYGYRSDGDQKAMMKAQADDWAEYVASATRRESNPLKSEGGDRG